MVNEREKLIGARLRKFRESFQIPRTKFAVSIGCTSERIASYEAGRAPLRYEVFRAMTQRYYMSPRWLATGVGVPVFPCPFNDTQMLALVKPGALFSEVYDAHIAARVESDVLEAEFRLDVFEKKLSDALVEFWDDASIPSSQKDMVAKRLLAPFMKELARVERGLRLRRDLTSTSLKSKSMGVKSEIEKLLAEVKRKASMPGAKSELARALGVAPARVSEWLSGRKEPGGETTLKLLHWVEQQERQK